MRKNNEEMQEKKEGKTQKDNSDWTVWPNYPDSLSDSIDTTHYINMQGKGDV